MAVTLCFSYATVYSKISGNSCSMVNYQKVHFIGIGGIGMCGLAEILLNQGCQVSGSDEASSQITQRLSEMGANFFLGHQATNIQDAELVIYSSAINPQNPELLAAKQKGILTLKRGELLAKFMEQSLGVAIAGTHGKTTTTGMISYVLKETALNPTSINGGILQGGISTVHLGSNDYFVAEADESDVSFLLLNPKIAVITNVEADHLENYSGDFSQLKNSFLQFGNSIPKDGLLICGIDNPELRNLLPYFHVPIVTFGFSEDADFQARDYQQKSFQGSFFVKGKDLNQEIAWQLQVPGRHNIQNALATIATCHALGIDEITIRRTLASFPGMGRRFHLCGRLPVKNGETLIYTDYGHHPSEIAATIKAAKEVWPNRRIVMVFQPHRFSRTQALLDEFVTVLATADVLILMDIYSAGESPLKNLNGETLFELLKNKHNKMFYIKELTNLPSELPEILEADDIVFLQGAGSIGTQAVRLLSNHFVAS